ncbi:uncharacterized protein EV420DRAFT_1503141 [Desarmillaria tabescens]|uniref:DUF1793-domain-containing protein n=1 Tax=Armillaria tabescens TaxID=1929756 RepID=A0AA39U6U3_ARMTA|nr:uncharacterized protein EV420DRAFT_1503141 [Desarmillaria tabescens]KAK0468165.1 hypothetical protein EV420DRAFT_1503141 [Desarmillaria tabescens]
MRSLITRWFFLCVLIILCRGATLLNTSPFTPPSYPLAVRSPYLSTWLAQKDGGTALNDDWSRFYTGQITGWAGLIKVDNTTYSFLGTPAGVAAYIKATQKSAQFTSTQTKFVMTAGPVDLTVTFLSPVEPHNLTKQSFPFSYLALAAAANDGLTHSVSVYSDISGEWLSGNTSLGMNWTTTTTGDHLVHQAQLQAPSPFAEIDDRTQYGSIYYATRALANAGVTYQTGADVDVRNQFINHGVLSNSEDSDFRAVQDHWPVLAFAHDLGNISASTVPVVVAIGHVRDPAIQYIVADGVIQERSLYFLSQTTVADYIPSFLSDYTDAITRANNFDNIVESDASYISSDYADIVALSIRQAFAGTEITLIQNSNGSWSTDDVLVFMKEISSSGKVNTVDVMFPAWPLFLYTNPELGKYLLNAAFEYQATGQYPNRYSVHDIGSRYPNATGHNDGKDEPMPVEECGNMIIMALSYAQKTGDVSQLTKYFDLLDQWAQYLISDSLLPANQLSTDDIAGTLENQTNLAIKGIVGISAMAKIADMVGDDTKSNIYSAIASDYASQWQNISFSDDDSHLTLSYGNSSSWGLSYNLYADKLLNLNIFPESVYETQTKWYPAVANKYGVPLDTRHTYTSSVWEIWAAAIMTNNSTRDLFISSVKDWVSSGLNSQPFGDFYNTTDGGLLSFKARPVVGGHLALETTPQVLAPTPEVDLMVMGIAQAVAVAVAALPLTVMATKLIGLVRACCLPCPYFWYCSL